MIALILFAFLAGAATALSPCVLPVLPVVLSAGVTGGNRRPLGIVVGLTLSFTFAVVVLVYLISALGLPADLLRNLAIAVLLGFGIALLIPSLAARLEVWISRVVPTPKSGPTAKGSGFGSGVLVGLSLGLVYAPCAGPILAGVITVTASQAFTVDRLLVAFAYALGSAVVLYVLMRGGRKLVVKLSPQAGKLQMAMGAIMVVVALLMFGNYDIQFQTAIADKLPAFVVNPSGGLEDNVDANIAGLDKRNETPKFAAEGPQAPTPSGLPILGDAPDFVGNQKWFNTPGGKGLTLEELRGKVVLVDFWTYSCINCIRTLPYLKAWDERYRDDGLVIVGVHSPEFPFERDADNVSDAIKQNGLQYPVAQDNDFATWNAYQNRFWPAEYFVDAQGRVRYTHFGEGEYEEKEDVIRKLLAEAGDDVDAERTKVAGETRGNLPTTPETYLGAARADGFINGPVVSGLNDYRAPVDPLELNELSYEGKWRITDDSATAVDDARLNLYFTSGSVYLVLGTEGNVNRKVRVRLDGKPITAASSGRDVRGGQVSVNEHRLYRIVELDNPGEHLLTLDFDPGVSGYAFTFG